ncbi:MAG: LytTR family transcriptional regulator [Xanthomonadales bacterium]|nr:LytTR family transcriptional regulator [Xanthomonadaceae bacterium]MBN8225035.1 LytTR family transcriptional regulator [Xanthomonadales bacterium]MCA0198244.1 LytTR family transcriptional regulator [Pseudomonadota bacterium]HRF83097.1 LytTR family DNA-binding domain-containing protein [Pseudoxanthomonas sp.]
MRRMPAIRPTLYERYAPWRRWVEVGFWIALTVVNATANSYVVIVDIGNNDLPYASWQPVVWEWSSELMWLALVWPIAWFSRRFPIHLDTWHRHLPLHLLASVVVSFTHVLGMVGLRMLAYRLHGQAYEFGDWPRGLFYEYVKDVRSYAGLVVLIGFYRLLLRRMQGEASLLSAPDEGAPADPVDRPERFLVRKLGREFLVAAADIEWLQASGNYVNLRVRGHDYPLRSTIAGIESRLDPRVFARVHRSYIVNLGLVASIEPLDAGEARLHLRDGTTIPCSRRYRQELRGRIGGRDAFPESVRSE